jgi:hypothetical protein
MSATLFLSLSLSPRDLDKDEEDGKGDARLETVLVWVVSIKLTEEESKQVIDWGNGTRKTCGVDIANAHVCTYAYWAGQMQMYRNLID